MTRANITSWKTLPLPEQREPLAFAAEFTDAETELLVFGLIPREMEDKWFICLHQGWLLFHRSWTGACIYGLRLEAVRGGARACTNTRWSAAPTRRVRRSLRLGLRPNLRPSRRARARPVSGRAVQRTPRLAQGLAADGIPNGQGAALTGPKWPPDGQFWIPI